MAREIKWSEYAWYDLEETADYISRDSEYYAKTFVKEINDAVGSLSEFSERGRVVPEFDDTAIRELFVRKFRLIYKINDNYVFIIAIIHGARDLLKMWDNDKRIPN